MLALTFGDPIEHGHAIALGIKAIHARVRGELREPTGVYPAGTPYSAEDPALVLWVHATLIESVLLVVRAARRAGFRRGSGPLPAGSGGRRAGAWGPRPRTPAHMARTRGLSRAAKDLSGRIAVGSDARMVVDAVLFPPLSAISGPFAWVNRLITLGLLPSFVRDQYQYAWSDPAHGNSERATSAIRDLRRVTPKAIAWWPEARQPANSPSSGSRVKVRPGAPVVLVQSPATILIGGLKDESRTSEPRTHSEPRTDPDPGPGTLD